VIGRRAAFREAGLAAKFAGVGWIGLAIDAALLQLGLHFGMEAAWARVISLICAMQATFLVNGLYVFKTLDRRRLARQWLGYMTSNGFGNFCNYWIFVTLVSLHWRLISAPMFALCVGAVCAWAINFTGARLLVFRKAKAAVERSWPLRP
jgi:putative flippase GtrA